MVPITQWSANKNLRKLTHLGFGHCACNFMVALEQQPNGDFMEKQELL